MYLLSIISPFHNSEQKCRRLLKTLASLNDSSIEVVFVDDGSVDGTLALLKKFQRDYSFACQVVAQVNKGPGGARNAGLKIARGKYVWFVDSDDDIRPEAIIFLKNHAAEAFDFIDFDLDSAKGKINSMNLLPGRYENSSVTRTALLESFGRICTKILRKDFILKNEMFYPEYCVYEDNALLFIYPFHVEKFLKSEVVGYVHHQEHESITRSEPSLRFFDRMDTAAYGLKRGLALTENDDEKDILNQRFARQYLFITAKKFITRSPSQGWIIACRIMRRYREVAAELDIKYPSLPIPHNANKKYKILFFMLWAGSYLLKSPKAYFEKNRLKTWGRPFDGAR